MNTHQISSRSDGELLIWYCLTWIRVTFDVQSSVQFYSTSIYGTELMFENTLATLQGRKFMHTLLFTSISFQACHQGQILDIKKEVNVMPLLYFDPNNFEMKIWYLTQHLLARWHYSCTLLHYFRKKFCPHE